MGGDTRRRPPVASAAQSAGTADAVLARQDLVRSHLPLVRAVARRYGGSGEDLEELVQVGSLALVKASGRFDPARGIAFASFATPAVEGGIRRYLRDRNRRGGQPIRDGDQGAEPAGDQESADESESRVLLADGLRVLDERERRIVFLRFHADMTERQIASTIGISQAHVSRLLEGALAKLRAEMAIPGESDDPGDTTENRPLSPDGGGKIEPVRACGQRIDTSKKKKPDPDPDPGHGPATDAERSTPADRPEGGEPGSPSRRSGRSRNGTGYSGRILVRMPSELHEQLAQAAERDEVSLNRFVTEALSTSVDSTESKAPGAGGGLKLAVVTNLAVVVVAAVAAVVLLVLALQRGL
jgi:RNA polymerase sigma-B factor